MHAADLNQIDVKNRFRTTNRETSWLRFNARVLQEARDTRNPLYERIKFLAIFSSNLDEFYRVRVASLRSLVTLKKTSSKKLSMDPERLLKKITRTITSQQELFRRTWANQIVPELESVGIAVVSDTSAGEKQKEFARAFFQEKISTLIQPYSITKQNVDPFLQNRSLYLVADLLPKQEASETKEPKPEYAILEVPIAEVGRFLQLPREGKKLAVIFIEDVIRLALKEYFPQYIVRGSYAVKLTRDAELYIDDEFHGDLLKKIERGLHNRKRGVPCRFQYDAAMPKHCLDQLAKFLRLQPDDMVAGGTYHNFSDLFGFPKPDGSASLYNKPQPSLPLQEFDESKRIHSVIRKHDVMLHYPYQSYDYVLRFLREAAKDPKVLTMKITLYRIADRSEIVETLKTAARNGKEVTAFIEVKARFDEERNLFWAGELERAGVNVLYSFPGLKVHCKLCIVTRLENDVKKRYAYLATGNFNEKTAALYTDIGLFTANDEITKEVNEVFRILGRKDRSRDFKHLLVAPFNMRKQFIKMIDKEIANAAEGKKAYIICKFNSLEDTEMIHKLYEASSAGVKIRLICRGICCALPGVERMSSNIKAISIVDRYLEHSRLYVFANDGDEKIYASSADWMTRNLNFRIETAFPILDEAMRQEIRELLELQWRDNVKARVITKAKSNLYRRNNAAPHRSQVETYLYYKKRNT